MYTVSEAVEELLHKSSLLEEGLEKGIINYSSLARELRPAISEMVMKEIKTGAIVMAIKRYADKVTGRTAAKKVFSKIPDITVRSNLAEYTFASSPSLSLAQSRFIAFAHEHAEQSFLITTQGIYETTIIVNAALDSSVKQYFLKERLISTFGALSAITIKLPEIVVTTPGVYGHILRALEWNGINVVEVASTYTEFTIILQDRDIERAFTAIKKTLS